MKGGGILKIKTRLFANGQRLAVEFEDTGSGIPKKDQPKIFDPFFTTKKVGKIGFGIVHVLRHHQEIWRRHQFYQLPGGGISR